MSIWTPQDRVIRPPDFRGLIMPKQSAQPLNSDEIDYDDLIIHKSWRVHEPAKAAEVRYFMYQLSQRDVGSPVYQSFYKAVRFLRVTRVPRYLRQMNGGSNSSGQQRKLLAGLREQQVLFINLIAKAPNLPLVFAYGAQAVGSTVEEAQAACDNSFAVLQALIDGVYQQMQYAPIKSEEAELLVRYQSQWRNIAIARGRPRPGGADAGVDAYLDGNRTDTESTQGMLDSFVRGMTDKSFMLSLITVPVSPYELSGVWRNLAKKLSDIRSEQSGSRAVSAGFALPLAMGAGVTDSAGGSHQAGNTTGIGSADSTSHSNSVGVTHGISDTSSNSVSHTQGTNVGFTEGVGVGHSLGTSASATESAGLSHGASSSQSLGESVNQGSTWSSGISDSSSAGINNSTSLSNSASNTLSQGITLVDTNNDGVADSISSGSGTNSGNNGNVSIPGLGSSGLSMGQSNQQGQSTSHSLGSSSSLASSLTSGGSRGLSLGETAGNSLTRTVGVNESLGGTSSYGLSATNSVGQSASTTQGLSHGLGLSDTNSQSSSLAQNAGASTADTTSAGRSFSVSDSTSATATDGVGQALMANQAYSSAYVSALSKATQGTSTLGVIPNLGVMLSKNTYDEGKRVLGDLIEGQMNRYLEGIESGAYFYQLFLVCDDADTLSGASGLLKSAFWGPGDNGKISQPFHVTSQFNNKEKDRLLSHASAFTSYRKREPNVELVEPYVYSTFLTPGEGAAMTSPPTSESLGMLAVHDSMPVFAMPYDRADKDIYLGHIINGERGIVSDQPYGLALDELVHTLVAGATGSGKTTLLRRLVLEATQANKEVIDVSVTKGSATSTVVPTGALILDWARSFRGLAALVPEDRFAFYCISKPELGAFKFNPVALPDESMNATEWANALSDLFMVAFGLGEFARSIFYEKIAELYGANRLEPYVLRPEVRNQDGQVVRPAIELPAVDPETLPPNSLAYDPTGGEVVNVYSCPALARLVSLEHVAVLIAAALEHNATREGKAMGGTNMQDRLQTVWRRIMVFAPGGALCELFGADLRLDEPTALKVQDLIDPDKGLVTVIEADGLDLANRKFVLGSVLQAVFRYGLTQGEGVFDQDGRGPGTFIVMEEAHELFGNQGDGEDREAAATRVAIYESMFRRARQLGLKLIVAVQNPAQVPNAILGNVGCVIAHQLVTEEDKRTTGALFNWISGIGQQFRELRYLGEMAVGHCIIRLRASGNFLQAAPVHIAVDAPDYPKVSDEYLATKNNAKLSRNK